MPTYIPTPTSSTLSKASAGTTDVSVSNGVYKFMGCSVVTVNCTIGFNGTPSSLNITLVEDVDAGDSFTGTTVPRIWAFSWPKGGVGQPIIYTTAPDLTPDAFYPTNVPFYFCGICTSWSRNAKDISGKTISVTIVDPREYFAGIQCLLNGFALSQNIGGGSPRYSNVNNVIDVFGYYNYGMESDRNQYGLQWSKIKDAIEAVRITVKGLSFEFIFTGETFTDAPTWYRIAETIMDLGGLCYRVCEESGSDYIAIARKTSSTDCVVEIRGIRRSNTDVLTQSDLTSFISARSDIVDTYRLGRETRNEFTSSIILGGMRNSNYTAYPSQYKQGFHVTLQSGVLRENYNLFDADIKTRLFGGWQRTYTDDTTGSDVTVASGLVSLNAGAIFPYWGFTPDDLAYPLIEPLLPLHHLAFDKDTENYGFLTRRIPMLKISTQNFPVRQVSHQDVFLTGDGSSDYRPFAYLETYLPSGVAVPSGYVRGLPLNTEVLRGAMNSKEAFQMLYFLYYPDIASNLFPVPDFQHLYDQAIYQSTPLLWNESLVSFCWRDPSGTINSISRDTDGKMAKALAFANIPTTNSVLDKFSDIIYEHVKNYALENMGKRFLAVLPSSTIMHRIWSNLPVPTPSGRPEIEYVVDQRGYWEYVPPELDGIGNTSTSGTFTRDEENQILRRFMAEDGRFYAMVGMDHYPSGNCSFNSNAMNRAMFQDLPTSEFRPSKIASASPKYVLISASVNQLVKRPDLALVELPNSVFFDPRDGQEWNNYLHNFDAYNWYETMARKQSIVKLLWYFVKKNNTLRSALKTASTKFNNTTSGMTFAKYASMCVNRWAEQIYQVYGKALGISSEPVMDLKGIIIPLTSTWVSYGPYYATYSQAKGMTKIETDDSLVPWNFARPTYPAAWYSNLDAAGYERLVRTISDLDYVDSAVISVAGFPELGLGSGVGFNSNLTSISTDYSVGAVKTNYTFSTYAQRPGTYRKSDYDNVSKSRIDTREKLAEIENINIVAGINDPGRTNQFKG